MMATARLTRGTATISQPLLKSTVSPIPRRQVSSFLTPLGAAFNTKNFPKLNFLGGIGDTKSRNLAPTGLFGIPELAEPEGFGHLQRDCLRASDGLVEEVISEPVSLLLFQLSTLLLH